MLKKVGLIRELSNFGTLLFKKYGSITFIDITYKLSNRNWNLMTICIVDNFNDTKLIAWSLAPDEQKVTLEMILRLFLEANEQDIGKLQIK